MFAFLVSLAGWIWDGFKAAESAIVAGLVAAYNFLKVFASAIWDGAKFFYNDILKPIGVWLDKAYQQLKKFYDTVIAPVQKWLQRITKEIRKIYNTYVAPVLAVIDGLRKTLELLKLLHVQWAAELDSELQKLEQKINGAFLFVIQAVNLIDSTISKFILTADNLFQRVTHLNTLRRDIAAVQNIQWNALTRNVQKGQAQLVVGPPAPDTAADFVETFGNPLTDDSPEQVALVAELRDYFVGGAAA